MTTIRVRLDLAYDGTDFAGWARQPGLRTVQGELEDALAVVLRTVQRGVDAPRLVVAGRTDAGVHARGQVAHFEADDVGWQELSGRTGLDPGAALVRRLAGVVGPDLVVRAAAPAPAVFDARFSALARRYAYRIADSAAARDPLRRREVLFRDRSLDVTTMAEAARGVVGQRDFAAFCRPRAGATTIRVLELFDWQRPATGPDAGLVVATVRADAFCHSMVRALVGASLAVGEGRRDPGWLRELLDGRSRHPGSQVAPAHGLTLEEVTYPPDEQLAVRAARTRAPRGPVR